MEKGQKAAGKKKKQKQKKEEGRKKNKRRWKKKIEKWREIEKEYRNIGILRKKEKTENISRRKKFRISF